jgi:hypothetical protein
MTANRTNDHTEIEGPAFFRRANSQYEPARKSLSAWTTKQLSGTSVCGLLAHGSETRAPRVGFTPARFTAEMFSPVLDEAIELRTSVAQKGTRIYVVDVEIVQSGKTRARATVNYLQVSSEPDGRAWHDSRDLPVPDVCLDHENGSMPLFKSGDGQWTHNFSSGLNSQRKSVWNNIPPIVDGLPITPLERAAVVADFTNLVCNWGSAGVGYINTDITMTLSRLPEGPELGLRALDRESTDGVATGAAIIYDRTGALGYCTITALANGRRQVDVAAAGRARAATAARATAGQVAPRDLH